MDTELISDRYNLTKAVSDGRNINWEKLDGQLVFIELFGKGRLETTLDLTHRDTSSPDPYEWRFWTMDRILGTDFRQLLLVDWAKGRGIIETYEEVPLMPVPIGELEIGDWFQSDDGLAKIVGMIDSEEKFVASFFTDEIVPVRLCSDVLVEPIIGKPCIG